MSETHTTTTDNPPESASFSFSIWPPTDKTREAVRTQLIKTLSSPSLLWKRHGTIPEYDAAEAAKRIEEEAYVFARSAAATNEKDGFDILKVYSKEISRRMLDTVQARSGDLTSEQEPEPDEIEEDVESTGPPHSEKNESAVDAAE